MLHVSRISQANQDHRAFEVPRELGRWGPSLWSGHFSLCLRLDFMTYLGVKRIDLDLF